MGKNRPNRSNNKIKRLPKDVREAVDIMLQGGYTYKDVAKFIKDNAEVDVSLSAISNYTAQLEATTKEMNFIQEGFKAMSEQMERYPNLDTTEGIARLLSYRVLKAIQDTPAESWQEIDPLELLDKSAKLMRVVTYKRDTDIKHQNIRDIAFDSYKEEVFAAMAEENPQLYADFVKFLNQKQAEQPND